MRLWTIDPCYLDRKGLVALWREALGAQAALLGETKGYANHPQLIRWKNNIELFGRYLHEIHLEGVSREYKFDPEKIKISMDRGQYFHLIKVSYTQLEWEAVHLFLKMSNRIDSGEEYLLYKTKKSLLNKSVLSVASSGSSIFNVNTNKSLEPWEKGDPKILEDWKLLYA